MQSVYFGKGDQQVVTIPHRGGAPVRVTGGTFVIIDARRSVDDDEHTLVPSTAVTLDPTSSTLSAKAGRMAADRRIVTVTDSSAYVEGHAYLLEGPAGQAELVRVTAIPSATTVRVAREIRGDFATGSTLRGIEVTATFPGTAAADIDNLDGEPFVVIWALDGLPPLRDAIRVERGEEGQLASLDDLAELDPMIPLQGGDRVDAATALARAHKDLRTDLRLANVSESDLLAGPIGRDAVTYRAAQLCFMHSEDLAGREKAKEYGARYQKLLAGLVIGVKKEGVVNLDKREETARRGNPAVLFYGFGFAPGGDQRGDG